LTLVRRLLALFALPLLLLAACGGDDDDSASTATTAAGAATTPTTAAAPVSPAADDPVLDAVAVTGDFGSAPAVDLKTPFATTQTVRRVLSTGTGAPLATGTTIVFDYAAYDGASGQQFDKSYGATPATAQLSATAIIPGIVKGLLGVNVGSRVVIGISPDDGFGPMGGIEEANVAATDSVVFVVDVKDARTPLTRAQGTAVAPVAGQPTVTLAADGTPTITMPGGTAPTTLVTQPLITGTGPAVASGQTISVHYVGAIWGSGKVFDSSWARGEPASFQIGTGNVIKGWDQGLVGQTVGSQVLLVIPPDLGYGSSGNADAGISGTDTLVFVVDILDAF
jgi:peptidylprolyl isomerase